MTSPVSPSETIAKAMEGEFCRAAVNLVDTLVLERETNGQSKEFMDWAVFMTVRAFEEQLSALALKLEAMQREMAELRKSVRNAMGAIESNQVADKDVHGTLSRVINRLDALSGARSTLIQGEKK